MAPTQFPVRSQTERVVTFKIIGTNEEMQWPCKVCTTVLEAKQALSQHTFVHEDKIDFFHKSGVYMKKQLGPNQLQPNTLVKGLKSFKPQKKKWPHPVGIIGAGYNGLKTAIAYLADGDDNIVLFDRNDRVGGYCWLTGANKTSRLQTEFGSFHVWWGTGCKNTRLVDYPNCNIPHEQGGWHIWPYRSEIRKHFYYAAEAFGVNPHVHFQSNVSKLDIVGGKDEEERHYNLTVKNLKDDSAWQVPVSVMWCYPGSLTQNRIIDYPGEDEFDGDIRYGMNDDTPYEKLKDAQVAVLGNGAFAIENVRTCIECGGTKAYVITRRKNLASPRFPCWFVHQGPAPTPGSMILKMFEPMYEASGMGSPWDYWSVHAGADRKHVTIMQNSRFGIGDVTFLMHAWGLLEFKVATVKRFSRHTLHLSTGEKLENITVVLKALGLLGDFSVDKLHKMTEMVGQFCSGDWRRVLHIDATGMNAANFTTFSTGIASTEHVAGYKYLFDYPPDMYKAFDAGLLKTLPRHKEEPENEKPAYVCDVKFVMASAMIVHSMVPKMGFNGQETHGEYKYTMYHAAHGVDRTLEVAQREWDQWQATWKERGIEHDYTPYPYNKQMISSWFEDYSRVLNVPISVDGPQANHEFGDGQLSHLKVATPDADEVAW